VSGAFPAAVLAAAEMGATRLAYPQPVDDYEAGTGPACPGGIRVGMIARTDSRDAWSVARRRFPASEEGQLLHELAAEVSDSFWHGQLVRREESYSPERAVYWLYPFRNYRTFCPYLVGSCREVGEYLARYLRLGVRSVILDVPAEEDDLHHTQLALEVTRPLCTARVTP
jgi:alkanesulfonate monooxygenase